MKSIFKCFGIEKKKPDKSKEPLDSDEAHPLDEDSTQKRANGTVDQQAATTTANHTSSSGDVNEIAISKEGAAVSKDNTAVSMDDTAVSKEATKSSEATSSDASPLKDQNEPASIADPSQIKIEEAAPPLHQKARKEDYSGCSEKRFKVPDDKVDWKVEFPGYSPVNFIHENVIKAIGIWADVDIEEGKEHGIKFNAVDGKVDRTSKEGEYKLDNGRPLNPRMMLTKKSSIIHIKIWILRNLK